MSRNYIIFILLLLVPSFSFAQHIHLPAQYLPNSNDSTGDTTNTPTCLVVNVSNAGLSDVNGQYTWNPNIGDGGYLWHGAYEKDETHVLGKHNSYDAYWVFTDDTTVTWYVNDNLTTPIESYFRDTGEAGENPPYPSVVCAYSVSSPDITELTEIIIFSAGVMTFLLTLIFILILFK